MNIVFAKTRYDYGSYRDYWKLVELAGFATCHVDEMDLSSDSFYIVSPINGEFRPHIDHCRRTQHSKRAVVTWWNLERPDTQGSPPFESVVTDILSYADAIWVSDRHYQSLDPRMHHVVLGSDPNLCAQFERRDIVYDFTHQSYVWGRRDPIMNALRSGLREGPNGWFDERDATLKASRVMVNVHQTDALIGEPLRFAVTAAYKMPMISETLRAPFPLVPQEDYLDVPYAEVVAAVRRSATMHPDALKHLGENLHKRLCLEWTFRRGVEQGVSNTLVRLGVSP